jgi:hypothetical protein
MLSVQRADLLRVIAARVLDLRAEFEAQLRAVAHIEEALRRADPGNDDRWRRLDDTLQRHLSEMLGNNSNIRTVLNDLSRDARLRSPTKP